MIARRPNGLELRQVGRHVDLLTTKAFSWKLPGGSGQNLFDSRPSMQAEQAAAQAQPAGSASAGGCVITPNSPIAFPLRSHEPGEHTRIAPTSCFPHCHSWGWRPTGPSFHTVWRVVGPPLATPESSHSYQVGASTDARPALIRQARFYTS